MESPWSDTGVFPEGEVTRPTNVPPLPTGTGMSPNILTDFKQHVEDTKFQTGELVVIEIPIYPLLLKHQRTNVMGAKH